MDFMTILGVVTGLATVYLVLALSITAINEAIAAYFSSRGDWLRKGVHSLLAPPEHAPAELPLYELVWRKLTRQQSEFEKGPHAKLVKLAYDSPFISHLGHGPSGHGFLPSYIPAWTLLQGLMHAPSKAAALAAGASADHAAQAAAANSGDAALTGAATQAAAVAKAAADSVQTVFTTLAQIKAAAEQLPAGSPLRVGVLNLIDGCNGSVEMFQQRFEAWFATFENQVIAWYKQKTHAVVIGLSLCLAVAVNVDTFALAKQLSQDKNAREAAGKLATEIVQAKSITELRAKAQDEIKDKEKHAKAAQLAASAASAAAKAASVANASSAPAAAVTAAKADSSASSAVAEFKSTAKVLQDTVKEAHTSLADTGLKLGWSAEDRDLLDLSNFGALLFKFFGLLVSAMAISLGAPFWFEVLKSLAAIRSVGQNPTEKAAKKVS